MKLSFKKLYLSTFIIATTFNSALSRMTDFTTRAVMLARTTLCAESSTVAFAGTVAGYCSFGTANESVAVVIWRTATLNCMVDNTTTSTLAACSTFRARISALVVNTRFVVGTTVVTATTDVTKTLVADLVCTALVVAVADGFADSTVAAFVVEAVCIAVKKCKI